MTELDPIVAELRAERVSRGLSQTALGHRIGNLTYGSIHGVESGTTSPTLRSLRRITEALGFELVLRRRDGAS